MSWQDDGPSFEGPEQHDIDRTPSGGGTARWLARFGRAVAVIVAALILVSLLLTSLPIGRPPGSSQRVEEVPRVAARVTRVISGDTITVDVNGQRRTVVYLSVTLPPFGTELFEIATEVNRAWVGGQDVLLEQDVTDVNSDGYLLRYVWVDEVMINAALIGVGLARHESRSPDTRYTEGFTRLEASARSDGMGIWSDGSGGDGSAFRATSGSSSNVAFSLR